MGRRKNDKQLVLVVGLNAIFLAVCAYYLIGLARVIDRFDDAVNGISQPRRGMGY